MSKCNLYTGTGDKGKTSLIGGLRVSKNDPRLDAYGTIDELNAFIGMLSIKIGDSKIAECLQYVQHKLFVVGAHLATDSEGGALEEEHRITENDIRKVESIIDQIYNELTPLTGFVLPAGTESAVWAHICRTICRRAERQIYDLIETGKGVEDSVLIFMNRLSDLLFAIARSENFEKGENEIIWDNACS